MRKRRCPPSTAYVEWLEPRAMLAGTPSVPINNPVHAYPTNPQDLARLRIRAPKILARLRGGAPVTFTTTREGIPQLLATFTSDLPASMMSVAIDWGDGVTTGATVSETDKPWRPGRVTNYTAKGTHAYQTAGDYTIRIHVEISAPLGMVDAFTTLKATVHVAPNPLEGTTFQKIVGIEGDTNGKGDPAIVGYTTDPLVTVMIDWGDGTAPTPGTVITDVATFTGEGNPPKYSILGTHSYQSPGTYDVTVRADGVIGPVVHSSAVVNQNSDNGTTYNATTNQMINFSLRYFPAASASLDSVDINWGDGTVTQATLDGVAHLPSQANLGAEFQIDGSHAYTTMGNYRITVTGHFLSLVGSNFDQDIAYSTAQISLGGLIIIHPFTPTLTGTTVHKVVGDPAVPQGDSTIAYANTLLSNIMIDWGDGSTPTPGTISQPTVVILVFPGPFGPPPTYYVRGSHVYTQAGTYTVTITAQTFSLWNLAGNVLNPMPTPTLLIATSTVIVTDPDAV